MSKRVCVIEGDGIGREVVPAALSVLAALRLPFDYTLAKAGYGCYQECGDSIPAATVAACREADAVLFGAVTTPPDIPGYKSAIITLRKELDLYANLRPTRSLGVPGYREGVDLTIVRENTEGLYSGQEEDLGDVATAKRVITRKGSERIARAAFELARREGRPRVTIVHKANVLRKTCGLFRRTAFAVAKDYPDITADEMLVDAMAMRLIRDPEKFSVIVTTNLFGDILSDEASMLVGGLGLAAAGNIGERGAIFEPVHGSAPDIAGKGVANPLATILAAALLCSYLGEQEAAERLNRAVASVIRDGILPPDLGGSAGTQEVTRAVVAAL
ncbi:MAG: isocitrate/isopropylmalate dehydrogenase family protein [Chloroflexi bacterium]|nr:isocitrate/isopropylmalate dehydrogenase family protein [Chloroflexota bacterium]MCL5109829.1 isocitrate/isopropylmalate dehydrogenase family protein [Chloroflexota bacterium]